MQAKMSADRIASAQARLDACKGPSTLARGIGHALAVRHAVEVECWLFRPHTAKGLSGHRHRARWAIAGVEAPLPLFDGVPQTAEPDLAIPLPSAGEDMVADYASIGLTLGRHPLSLIRKQLTARRCLSSADLTKVPHGKRVRFAGLVRMRQRPETASGVTFVTLEDEHGMVNAVVWKRTESPRLSRRLFPLRG